MAVSTFVKNFTHGSLLLSDGTGTPVTLTVDCMNGDFSISGLAKILRETAKYESRGLLKSVAHTTRTYPSGSFSAMMTAFTEAIAPGTLADFVLNQAAYSANVSTLGASAQVYAIDLVVTIEGTDFGDAADHTFTLSDCRCTIDFAEGDPNQFTLNFEVLGAVTNGLIAAES